MESQSIEFSEGSDQPRTIKASQFIGVLSSLFFYDKTDRELSKHNPAEFNPNYEQVVTLKDSERLIGVYGVKDKDSYFTSFGFLVIDLDEIPN